MLKISTFTVSISTVVDFSAGLLEAENVDYFAVAQKLVIGAGLPKIFQN